MKAPITSIIIAKQGDDRTVVTFRSDGTYTRRSASLQDVARIARWADSKGAVFHGQIVTDGVTSEVVTL